MPEFLTIAHVSLTVSDLDRSIPWYERLFDAKLVLAETTGPFRRAAMVVAGQALVGLQEFPDRLTTLPFNERRVGLDHRPLPVAAGVNLKHGRPGWTNSVSSMAVSSMRVTVPCCHSVIRTTSRWNSSRCPRSSGPQVTG